jgi:hypothetical protein
MRVRRETLLPGLRRDRLDASMVFAKCGRDLIAHVLRTHVVSDEAGFGFIDMQHVELTAKGSRQRRGYVDDTPFDLGKVHAREYALHFCPHGNVGM